MASYGALSSGSESSEGLSPRGGGRAGGGSPSRPAGEDERTPLTHALLPPKPQPSAAYQPLEERDWSLQAAGGAVVYPETYAALPGRDLERAKPLHAVAKGEAAAPGAGAGDGDGDAAAAAQPAYRSVFLVVLAQFMGYAILVSFQHKLKVALGISDDDKAASHEFAAAVSMLYIGNLCFRLAHNLLPLSSRARVYFSMGSMSASMALLLSVYVGGLGGLGVVYGGYALGGVGIGTFESNLLNSITALGHSTKLWAILGMPTGFGVVLLLGFFLTALGTPPAYIYGGVLVCLCLGAATFYLVIPVSGCATPAGEDGAGRGDDLGTFVANAKRAREWFPPIAIYSLALMVDMFMVACFSGLMLYLLNGDSVPLFGPDSTVRVKHDVFFVFYNSAQMVGDNTGRKLAYHWRRPGRRAINPLFFLGLTLVGGAMCLSLYAILAPLGIFLVFMTNGLVYASSTKTFDLVLDRRFSLIALSVWLAVGDAGSVAGSNLIPVVRDWICSYHEGSHYVCTSK